MRCREAQELAPCQKSQYSVVRVHPRLPLSTLPHLVLLLGALNHRAQSLTTLRGGPRSSVGALCNPDCSTLRVSPRCYWGFHSHFSREAEHLYHTLESSYQKALQSHLKNSDSIVSLPQSDRSSSSSQESLK